MYFYINLSYSAAATILLSETDEMESKSACKFAVLRAARREMDFSPRALQAPKSFTAARRYHRMASALSCATPWPSWNMKPKLD
jgi:hypothetical protein